MRESKAAALIKHIRQSGCLTQKQFADRIGVHKLTITSYERGAKSPRIDKLQKIIELAKEFGIVVNFYDFK